MVEVVGTLFDTAIGRCGIAWTGDLVTAVQLPERNDEATRLRLERTAGRSSDLPRPTAVQAAIDAMTALLSGERTDLSFVELDLERVAPFERTVYEATRTIAPGTSRTYGQVAELIGEPGGARAVGQALGANPFPLVVPCHRVLGAGGRLVGFSAVGGVETKRRILLIEGCPAVAPSLFD
jgi:methylated-DNA-[protein]-cysteine S-methyltransferase